MPFSRSAVQPLAMPSIRLPIKYRTTDAGRVRGEIAIPVGGLGNTSIAVTPRRGGGPGPPHPCRQSAIRVSVAENGMFGA